MSKQLVTSVVTAWSGGGGNLRGKFLQGQSGLAHWNHNGGISLGQELRQTIMVLTAYMRTTSETELVGRLKHSNSLFQPLHLHISLQ